MQRITGGGSGGGSLGRFLASSLRAASSCSSNDRCSCECFDTSAGVPRNEQRSHCFPALRMFPGRLRGFGTRTLNLDPADPCFITPIPKHNVQFSLLPPQKQHPSSHHLPKRQPVRSSCS